MNTKDLYQEYMITSMVSGFEDVEFMSAKDCTVTNRSGKEYLDCFSGIAVTNAGHGNREILDAAIEQMERWVHCCTYVYYNSPAANLAEKLSQITPGTLRKSFFGNSGAEAIEGALRIARQYTGRHEFIALTHSFHGRTNMTLSITGNSSRKTDGGPYASGIAFTPAPYTYRCPFGTESPGACAEQSAEYLRNVIRFQTAGDVAAMITEPILGEGGIIVPPDGFFEYVKEILEEHDILFICDEVQTGFGRTGKMFGIQYSGIVPDIMTTAKGIANGFPLSAFTVRPEIAEAFTPGSHLSTFGGNPVSCAAALSNIEFITRNDLSGNALERGSQIMNSLKPLEEETVVTGEVRGRGLMIGIELVKDSAKTPAPEFAKQIRAGCRERGILIGAGGPFGNVLRIQPPLLLREDEAARITEELARQIREVEKTL
ncbi:MAG: aspartate aminotransferase family protein [Spirochaetia bacterium]